MARFTQPLRDEHKGLLPHLERLGQIGLEHAARAAAHAGWAEERGNHTAHCPGSAHRSQPPTKVMFTEQLIVAAALFSPFE